MKTLILEEYSCNYDRIADVLYISFGNPIESYCDEVSEGVLIRHSLETDELSGITVIDYIKKKNAGFDFSIYFPTDICTKIANLLCTECQ